MTDRKILIIEDRSNWQEYLIELCEEASELLDDSSNLQVDVVDSLAEALDLIEVNHFYGADGRRQSRYALFTVDLNLTGERDNADGLKLMQKLATYANSGAIIISAETDIRYAIEGLQRHHAMAYIQKAAFDANGFVALVRIAFGYHWVMNALASQSWRGVREAMASWIKLTQDWPPHPYAPNLPANPLDSINSRLDTESLVPLEDWTEDFVLSLISQKNWALAVITVNNLDYLPAAKHTGTHPAEVMRLLGTIATAVLDKEPHPQDFVGRSSGNRLVVATSPSRLDIVVQDINRRFLSEIPPYYHVQDWENGFLTILINGRETSIDLLQLLVGHVDENDQIGTILDVFERANERQRRLT